MKYVVITLALVSFTSCKDSDVKAPMRNVDLSDNERCISGVVYYSWGQGLAAKFKPDSTVETCKGNN